MQQHWDTGKADMAHTFPAPHWLAHPPHTHEDTDVHAFDLTLYSPIAKRSKP